MQENELDYLVTAEPVDQKILCEDCDSEHIYRHGVRYPIFYHLPAHYKRVGIRAKLARYKCRACGHVGQQKPPNVDEKRDATTQLIAEVEKLSLLFTFAHISRDTGLDEKTVRRIFNEYAHRLRKGNRFETPEILGMDEVFIGRTYRLVLTNIKENTVYGIYKSRVLQKAKDALEEIPNRGKIKVVTMDMWDQYRKAVEAKLGKHIPIVADKFHVLRSANEAVENCRKRLKIKVLKDERDKEDEEEDKKVSERRSILTTRKFKLTVRERETLDKHTTGFPILGATYEAKELFFDFYNSKDRKEAHERFWQWKLGTPKEVLPFFAPLLSKLTNWEKEVFNYFDYFATNAFTESMNNIIRHVERPGRGYSFEALKTKVLYTYGFKRVKKPKFNRAYNPNIDTFSGLIGMPRAEEQVDEYLNYGVPISTFLEAYERGDF